MIPISGSVAYDMRFAFPGRFSNVLSMTQGKFNATFQASVFEKSFGGCAANAAYAARLLGCDPVVLSAAGALDWADYEKHFKSLGIRTDGVKIIEGAYCANCAITTDADGNQLTSFHDGAFAMAEDTPHPFEGATFALICASPAPLMLNHARALSHAGVPYVLDVGPGAYYLKRGDLVPLAAEAAFVTMNDAEWPAFLRASSLSEKEALNTFRRVVVTRGKDGADYFEDGKSRRVPAYAPKSFKSPVGAGDAFRGAFLAGLEKGLGAFDALRLGAWMASQKTAFDLPQGYPIDREELLGLFGLRAEAPSAVDNL